MSNVNNLESAISQIEELRRDNPNAIALLHVKALLAIVIGLDELATELQALEGIRRALDEQTAVLGRIKDAVVNMGPV